MNANIWPFQCNDTQFTEPSINDNKCYINGIDFIKAIQKCPELFIHIMKNEQHISSELKCYIDNISEIFNPALPIGTLGRLKIAQTEWQSEEKHRYVRLELIHCANYQHKLFSFHDDLQYGYFFIDMNKSMTSNSVQLYWDPERKEEEDIDFEEHIWCNHDMVEVIYLPQEIHNDKDKLLGLKDVFISYLKRLNNEKVEEFEALENETNSLLISRLRAKMRNEHHGDIISVQGIIQESLWESLEEKFEEITDEDTEFAKNINIISYKITRNQLWTQLQINPIYLVKLYDAFGKEMKMIRNVRDANLYKDTTSFTRACNNLILNVSKKYKSSGRVLESMNCFNGLRVSYNLSTRALIFISNNMQESVRVDIKKDKVQRYSTLGRNGGW